MRAFFTYLGGKLRTAPLYPEPLHEEVLALPLIDEGWASTDDLEHLDEGARNLIGFWLSKATSSPRKVPSKWARERPDCSCWGARVRERIASQVDSIRHWRLVEGDYRDAPDVEATWFIDPPYVGPGWQYPHGSGALDFAQLGNWARSRRGQAIVCEAVGATWLPFAPLANTKTQRGRTREAVWSSTRNASTCSDDAASAAAVSAPAPRKHVVMFSSGAGSWAAARRVADRYGTDNLYLLFSDVKGDNDDNPHAGEDEDNYRFLKEAAADVGGTLVWLNEGRDIWQVFRDKRYLGNAKQANCSHLLKQRPAREWLASHCDPANTTIHVGIDWTEEHRLAAIERNYAPFTVSAPLCERPYVDREQVLADLRARGIEPPRLYAMGFAHANCGGFCVRAGHGHFLTLLTQMPERYAYHEKREEELRQYLGKDVAILRDRSGGKVTPLTLRAFRERAATAPEQIDACDIGGCGCFTDESTEETETMSETTEDLQGTADHPSAEPEVAGADAAAPAPGGTETALGGITRETVRAQSPIYGSILETIVFHASPGDNGTTAQALREVLGTIERAATEASRRRPRNRPAELAELNPPALRQLAALCRVWAPGDDAPTTTLAEVAAADPGGAITVTAPEPVEPVAEQPVSPATTPEASAERAAAVALIEQELGAERVNSGNGHAPVETLAEPARIADPFLVFAPEPWVEPLASAVPWVDAEVWDAARDPFHSPDPAPAEATGDGIPF